MICVVVAFKFPFKLLSLSKSWTRRLAFSIVSPLFIAWIVAWVMFNWNWSTDRSAQQPSLLRVGFKSLFPRQLPATNRAFVIRSILVDYFYMEWAHIVIYIIVRTWIQGTSGQKNQHELVRFSWNCNWAGQWILFACQWQFPKDLRDHVRDRKQSLHFALIFECTF